MVVSVAGMGCRYTGPSADLAALVSLEAYSPLGTGSNLVAGCRPAGTELLDHTLAWNQQDLLHALPEFEHFYNEHRPH
jgi:hypothetical protein